MAVDPKGTPGDLTVTTEGTMTTRQVGVDPKCLEAGS